MRCQARIFKTFTQNVYRNRTTIDLTVKDLSTLLGQYTIPCCTKAVHQQHPSNKRLLGQNQNLADERLGPLADLQWWMSSHISQLNKFPLTLPPFDTIIDADASNHTWGTQCNGAVTGRRWNLQESRNHINILELKAALLAIKSFLR